MKTTSLLLLAFLFCQACIENIDNKFPTPSTPPPVGVPTGIGTPIGEPISQVIGPGGGTISWENGKHKLVFPQGALTSETPISIQPISHTLDLAVGTAFDFGPDGTSFQKPVELHFHYTEEELSGSSPEWIQIAFQDEKNIWQSSRNLTVDKANKTIIAKLPHFSRWSFFASAMIKPGQKALSVSQSFNMEVVGYEYELSLKDNPKYRDLLAPLAPPSLIEGRLIKEWLIDGKVSFTNYEKGTLVPVNDNRSKVRYTAPVAVPDGETVSVSAELNLGKGKFLLLSQITILNNNSYSVGSFSFTNAETFVGRDGNVLHIHMGKTSSSGIDSAMGFDIPGFSGLGSYPFSLLVKGGVGVESLNNYHGFTSIAFNEKSEPYYNGSIQITESSNEVGGNISGTISGTLYEPGDLNASFYIPHAFQASFATIIMY
ncbi:hypothetical protein [Pleomorphovibrio marinus]|uniref:hypothetical protein n=1 Tax=Pleomorphovibrio marinus TaxID=2164132 RepID=UPI000E0A6C7D|nr:hypothetical protein [Pleomorphovibrio marinus]